MMNRLRVPAAFCIPWLLVFQMGSGKAQNAAPSGSSSPIDTAYAPIVVNNRRVFDVTDDAGISAVDRADRINRRLQSLVDQQAPVSPFQPRDVLQRNGQTLVTLGGQLILTVTVADAQDALSSPQKLALVWGAKLSQAVAQARFAHVHPLHGIGILIINSFHDMILSGVAWLPRLAGALLLLGVFALLAKFASWTVRNVGSRTHLDPNLRQLARALAHYGTLAVGLIAALSVLGFQGGSIITAFGISGFVLGFAFKDILSHFLAGLMLLMSRQLRIGDQIIVSNYEGTVEKIELRALFLRTYDNRLVIIPNGDVFTSVVTSNTASPRRRTEFVIAIDYKNDIGKAKNIALEAIRHAPGMQNDPAPDVLVRDFTNSAVNLVVRFHTGSLRAEYLKVSSECMERVKSAFDRQNIVLAGSSPTTIEFAGGSDLAGVARQIAGVGQNSPTSTGDGSKSAD